jgi:hypothetical protein
VELLSKELPLFKYRYEELSDRNIEKLAGISEYKGVFFRYIYEMRI